MKPRSAMVFAAGFGKRLGALVRDKPKPLIRIAGRPLIDHALAVAGEAGVRHCVVNLHYHADKLAAHLAGRSGLTLIHEFPDILDTGGGLFNAAAALGEGPVFALNSDTVWRGRNPLRQLAEHWLPDRMDCLLLLVPPEAAIGHSGGGDFVFTANGFIRRSLKGEGGYVYTGAQIIKTGCLAGVGKRIFSVNDAWDRLIRDGKLAGLVHQGEIGDVGTPAGIKACETLMSGCICAG